MHSPIIRFKSKVAEIRNTCDTYTVVEVHIRTSCQKSLAWLFKQEILWLQNNTVINQKKKKCRRRMWQGFICLRRGAVTELWTQEWDFVSGEIQIESWLNGGYFAFKERLYWMGNMERIFTKFYFRAFFVFFFENLSRKFEFR